MEHKLESIAFTGLLGPVWTEETRTSGQVHEMLFPRLISLAERAWHKAAWEETDNTQERIQQTNMEWTSFAKSMANKELGRLEKIGIQYRIPVPGARWTILSIYCKYTVSWSVCISICRVNLGFFLLSLFNIFFITFIQTYFHRLSHVYYNYLFDVLCFLVGKFV